MNDFNMVALASKSLFDLAEFSLRVSESVHSLPVDGKKATTIEQDKQRTGGIGCS
jgi:hypothetical protein